jgi:hypothetical protein
VSMTPVSAGKSAEASWMNPATGAMQTLGVFPSSGTQFSRSAEDWPDAVLLLRDKKASAFALR